MSFAGTDTKKSSSVYAGNADNELGDKESISNWLLDRHAFLLTRVPLDTQYANDELPEKYITSINEHINFYNDMTAWSWPSQWTSLETLPLADSGVHSARTDLWDAYNQLPAERKLKNIEPSHVGIITSKFSALLLAVNGASLRDQVPIVYSPNEAERRRDWDMLLMRFYQTRDTAEDEELAEILLERSLNYSRNPLADVTGGFAQAHETLRTILRTYDRLCLGAVRCSGDIDPLRILAEASAAHQRACQANFKNRSTWRLRQIYEGHIAGEPTEGICDAVLLSPCEGGMSLLISKLGKSTSDQRKKFLSKFLFICGAQKKKPTLPMLPTKITEQDRPAVPKINVQLAPTAEDQGPAAIPSRSSARLQERRQDEFTNDHKKMLQDVFQGIDIGEKKRTRDEKEQDLFLPVLVAEYKKLDPGAVFTSMNQCRMYLVSALEFLNALGFKDRPVFGLVTNGTFGAVTMGWQIDGVYFVLERGVEKYNIADPFQALQFSLFLVRLAEYAKGLDKLKENKEILDKKLQSYTSIVHWSRRAQLSGYRLAKDEIAPAHEERDV